MEENKTQTNDYANYHGGLTNNNQIDDMLNQLILAIKDSKEYHHYQEIRSKIHLEPDKEQAMNTFRKRNYFLQSSKEDIDLFDEIDRLEQEFAAFRAEPLVEDFLAAELALCRLIQSINWKLMESLDFEVGFFHE